MLIDFPDMNTAPAMPRWFGKRICCDSSPCPTSDHSSPLLSSFRKSVERSAFSMRVASPMTRFSSDPSLMSAVTSETTSTNSISWARTAFIRSMNCALCNASVPCVVIASSTVRSRCVKRPLRLFSACATPINSPFTVRMGTHRMLRVTNPVCSSMDRLNRSSEYGSWMVSGSPFVDTNPAMPVVFGSRISRRILPCATREKSSLVAGSFRKSEPRSAPTSLVVISTSACSTSSSESNAAMRRETSRRSSTSGWRASPCSLSRPRAMFIRVAARSSDSVLPSSAMASVPRARRHALELLAQRPDRRLQLLPVAPIVAVHRRDRIFGRRVEALGLVAQCGDRLLQLHDLVFGERHRFPHAARDVLALRLERVAQRGRGVADLAQLVLAQSLRAAHRVFTRRALTLELLAKRDDRGLQLADLRLGRGQSVRCLRHPSPCSCMRDMVLPRDYPPRKPSGH